MAKDKDVSTPSPAPAAAEQCVETKKVVADFQKDCKEKKELAAIAEAKAAGFNLTASLQAVCDDRRSWKKAEDTRGFYGQLHYNMAIGLVGDIAVAQKSVDEQTKASDEIVKSYGAAVTKMKESCSKLMEVCKAAKDWTIEVKKTCNTKNKEDLKKLLESRGFADKDLVKKAEDFEKTAGMVQNGGDQVIETAVKVTGIYSFVNVGSIKPCMEDMKKYAEAFRADTEANLKTSDDKIKNALKLLGDDSPKLSEAWFAKARAEAVQLAIGNIANYLDPGVFPPKPDGRTLAAICTELSKTVGDASGGAAE